MEQNTHKPKTERKKRTPTQSPRRRASSLSAAAGELGIGTRAINGTQNPEMKLSEQQRLFVTQIVHHKMNNTAAARLAGYNQPATAAWELMRNPKVLKAIAIEREEYARASQMDRKRVVDGFLEAIDMARQKEDPAAMIAGWREVGKMCGLYEAQKAEVSVSVNGQVLLQNMENMSDEELLALADKSILEGEVLSVEYSQPSEPVNPSA